MLANGIPLCRLHRCGYLVWKYFPKKKHKTMIQKLKKMFAKWHNMEHEDGGKEEELNIKFDHLRRRKWRRDEGKQQSFSNDTVYFLPCLPLFFSILIRNSTQMNPCHLNLAVFHIHNENYIYSFASNQPSMFWSISLEIASLSIFIFCISVRPCPNLFGYNFEPFLVFLVYTLQRYSPISFCYFFCSPPTFLHFIFPRQYFRAHV